MKLPKFLTTLVLTTTFLTIENTALAQRYRIFENPTINNLWVDACVVEYGEVNCSNWAKDQSANAFCKKKGYSKYVNLKYFDEGAGHQTYRLTYFYKNGEKLTQWRVCNKCGLRLNEIECQG